MDLVRFRAATSRDKTVYRFLPGERKPDQTLTYAQLETRAEAFAARIAEVASPGSRALLLIPSGLDYVAAYFGCLFAGVTAVPAYPPHPRRPDPRVSAISGDCEPSVAVTTAALLQRLEHWCGDDDRLRRLEWLAVDDDHRATRRRAAAVDAQHVAMIQYTSGSTTSPRGVVLTHANLLHNLEQIYAAYPNQPDDYGMFWLPPFHDMGLIGGIVQPIYLGIGSVLMPSASFLQRPLSWLEAMSKYRCTTSAAPNFAFDLCVERIRPEETRGLDLSSWHTVFNGAEPIRAETIDRFCRAFEGIGFRRDAFFPCYGLAEATLFVAGGPWRQGPSMLDVSRDALEQKRIAPATASDRLRLVASGSPAPGQTVRIVDPQSRETLDERRVGEIWVAGPSVASRYWHARSGDGEVFGHSLAGSPGAFLRSGDLGFIDDGQLLVTGRLKDLIIISGRNYYPQDLELAAERSHPNIRAGHSAAFAIPAQEREQLALAIEVTRHHTERDNEAVFGAVRRAVAEREGVLPDVIILVAPNGIPRTSSGKVQRNAARQMLLDGSLESIARSDAVLDDLSEARPAGANPRIESWLQRWVADELQIELATVDVTASVREYGLDSVAAVRLVTELEQVLGRRVDVSLLWKEPSIRSLARALDAGASRLDGADAVVAGAERRERRAVSPLPASEFPEYRVLKARLEELERHGVENPYFRPHEGPSGATAVIAGRRVLNFATYNYLDLANDPRVRAAAVAAVERYGTSASASRLVSGERPIHRELEDELAGFLGVEDCLVFIGGVTANVSTLSHLLGPDDIVLCDELLHNSAMQGALFSGAKRLTFPHNDHAAAERLLRDTRGNARRALIVIEGVYSADGDIPDLAAFVEVKRRHEAWLMVDEAHSIGVLGKTGRGLAERSAVSPRAIDVWMGTLSKSLASVGGYIAARREIIEYLKYTAPGFVFSVGMAPASAAAALEALRILRREPDRVARLHENGRLFLEMARSGRLDTGTSDGTPIVPVIVGDSVRAVRVSQLMLERGINVQPMISPAVPESAARLRFFLASSHTPQQILQAVDATKSIMEATR